MVKWSRLVVCGIAVIAVTSAAVASTPDVNGEHRAVAQQVAERASGSFDPAAYTDRQRSLHARLVAEQVREAFDTPLRVNVSKQELQQLAALAGAQRRLAVGINLPLGSVVDFAGLDAAKTAGGQRLDVGAIRANGDGWLVWTAVVESKDAAALRVRLADLDLPRGAELFVYNLDGQAFGPYTGRGPLDNGELWAHAVNGPQLILQLKVPADFSPKNAPYFEIAEVGHLGPEFKLALLQQPQAAGDGFCSFNADCVENASCYGSADWSAIDQARDAAGHMLFVSGRYYYICSGGLVADSDPATQIPYFLTANHCISKDREAASLQVFFQFDTPCNGGTCYDPVGVTPSTSGASIAASDRTSDYTLLQLDEPAPAGSVFLGWSTAPVAFTENVDLYRISHPSGAPQAYSHHTVDTSTGTCSSWPRGDWIYSFDVTGATEGGSSGSPVLNAAGQIVGQLSGACGTNLNDTCDAVNNATVDGAFAAYYEDVAPLLGGGTSCTDADDDGYCVEDGDCNDGDPTVYPGATEICGDGVDNNCDGNIDEGCACLPLGDPCATDDECCSLKCRGKKGSKICR